MHCEHFDAGRCRSCSLLGMPEVDRVARLEREARSLLADHTAPAAWRSAIRGPDSAFRNKAKMVASGTTQHPVLGILDDEGAGVDLSDCPLYPPTIHDALAHIPALISRAQIPPYNVQRRRGELKHVIVTAGDEGALMVRFVLASAKPIPRLTEHLPSLLAAVPQIASVSVNLNPDHTAVLEGAQEIHVWGEETLEVTQGDVTLRVGPQSFLQTNSFVADQLYRQVAAWVDEIERARSAAPSPAADSEDDEPCGLRIWDLFCGVGGFALHCASSDDGIPTDHGPSTHNSGASSQGPRGPGRGLPERQDSPPREVTGVEISANAIDSAAQTAQQFHRRAHFVAADALSWARDHASAGTVPDVLIVNPPRRGLGAQMASWIEAAGIREVVYSSCNLRTLASDLALMPHLRVVSAQLLDMFPHTAHSEVLTRLQRVD